MASSLTSCSQDFSPEGAKLEEAMDSALFGTQVPLSGHAPVPSSWFCGAQPTSESFISEPPTTPTTPLQEIISNMFKKCEEDELDHIQEQYANIQQLCEDSCSGAGLGVTTGCSGTDLFVPVLGLFFRVFNSIFGVDPAVELGIDHLWSCEHIDWKCEWIRTVMGGTTVFKDLKDTSRRFAPEHSGITKPVLRGIVHACGFSCRSVSALHSHAKRFKKCIKHRAGSTGSTFWFSFQHARRHRPFMLLLENVSRFRGHNLRLVKRLLKSIGYVVIVLVVSLLDHGVPCRRVRVWIIAVLSPRQALGDSLCQRLQEYAEALERRVRQARIASGQVLG